MLLYNSYHGVFLNLPFLSKEAYHKLPLVKNYQKVLLLQLFR